MKNYNSVSVDIPDRHDTDKSAKPDVDESAEKKEQERRQAESDKVGEDATTEAARQGEVEGLTYTDKATDPVYPRVSLDVVRKKGAGEAVVPGHFDRAVSNEDMMRMMQVDDEMMDAFDKYGVEAAKTVYINKYLQRPSLADKPSQPRVDADASPAEKPGIDTKSGEADGERKKPSLAEQVRETFFNEVKRRKEMSGKDAAEYVRQYTKADREVIKEMGLDERPADGSPYSDEWAARMAEKIGMDIPSSDDTDDSKELAKATGKHLRIGEEQREPDSDYKPRHMRQERLNPAEAKAALPPAPDSPRQPELAPSPNREQPALPPTEEPERLPEAKPTAEETPRQPELAPSPNRERPALPPTEEPKRLPEAKPTAEETPEPVEPEHEPNHDFAVGSIDRSRTVDELAEQAAEERLANGDLREGDIKNGRLRMRARLRRAWRNSPMAREYYRTKYRREAREELSEAMERANRENHFGQVQGEDGDWRAMTAEEVADRAQTDSNYALFNMISTSAPETLRAVLKETDKTELNPDDPDYQATYNLVSQFATRNADGGWAMTAEEFQRRADEINEQMHGTNSGALDNFMAQALYVRGQVEHGEALEDVMKGFHMFDARANESVNTDAHRTMVDNLTRRYENSRFASSRFGAMVKPEYVAAAASTALTLSQTLSRSRVAQVASVGGTAALSGVFSAMREGERTSIAYANYNRAVAMGAEPNPGDSRFNRHLAETTLDMKPATLISQNMMDAVKSGNVDNMRQALTDFYLRNGVGAREGADLVSYSGGNQVNVERNQMMTASLQLQTAYINQMRAENPDYSIDDFTSWREGLQNLMDDLSHNREGAASADISEAGREAAYLYDEVDRGQKAFRKLRRRRMVSAGVKSTARSLAISGAAQEIMALANPDVQGVTEALQGRDTNASGRTFLADLANRHGFGGRSIDVSQLGEGKNLTPEQAEALRRQGYKVTEHTDTIDETSVQHQTAEQFTAGNRTVTARHWLDNNTPTPDRRELRLDLPSESQDGTLQFRIDGGAHGQGFNYSREQIMDLARDGHLKFAISPTKGTTGQPIIVSGHLDGSRLVADDPGNSSVLDAIRDRDFSRIEVVDTTNFDSTGALNVFATETGRGTANDIVTNVVNHIQHTTYTVETPPITPSVIPPVIVGGVPASARGYYSPAIPTRRRQNEPISPESAPSTSSVDIADRRQNEPISPESAPSTSSVDIADRRQNASRAEEEISPAVNEAQTDLWRTIGEAIGGEDGATLRSRLDEFQRQYNDSVDQAISYAKRPVRRPDESDDEYQSRLSDWHAFADSDRGKQTIENSSKLKSQVSTPLDNLINLTDNGTNDALSWLYLGQATLDRPDVIGTIDAEAAKVKHDVLEANGLDTTNWSIDPDTAARLIAYGEILRHGENNMMHQIDSMIGEERDDEYRTNSDRFNPDGDNDYPGAVSGVGTQAETETQAEAESLSEFGDGSTEEMLDQLEAQRDSTEGFSLSDLAAIDIAAPGQDEYRPLERLGDYVEQRDDGSFVLTERGARAMGNITGNDAGSILRPNTFKRVASWQYDRLRENPIMANVDDESLVRLAELITYISFLKRGDAGGARASSANQAS